ncbi:MAG: hypothetical protein K2Q01_04760 [Rickettsiales bacterium]|nr:hypothetical protein [Rickettsiales bacterium]
MSQRKDSEDGIKSTRTHLRRARIMPRLPETKDPTPLEEQVMIIGQLSAKLEILGVSKHTISALRAVHFRPEKAEIPAPDREILATREADETLVRLREAAKAARTLSRAEPPLTEADAEQDRAHLARIEKQDKKRAAYFARKREDQQGRT